MNVLIVYESKTGYTAECALRLETELNGQGKAVHVKAARKEDLAVYDHIVIGSAVYAGRVPSSIRGFVKKKETVLLSKPLSIFVCGTGEEFFDQYLKKNYPAQVLEHTTFRIWFGGKIVLSEHRGIKKRILASILKDKTELHVEKREHIAPFARQILES